MARSRIRRIIATLAVLGTVAASAWDPGPALSFHPEPDLILPDCGNEGEPECGLFSLEALAQEGNPPTCDRGLKVDNNGTPFIASDDTCVNDDRRRPEVSDLLGGSGNRPPGDWVDWALRNQLTLGIDEPFNWVSRLGTHNSYNNFADGYGFPNQTFSYTDQLRLGARSVGLDVHYITQGGFTVKALRVCHGDFIADEGEPKFSGHGTHPGCGLFERLYANAIKEIRNWLRANRDQVLIIPVEERVEQQDEAFLRPLEEYFGSRIFTPDMATAMGISSHRMPTTREMLDLGTQVIISTQFDFFGGEVVFDSGKIYVDDESLDTRQSFDPANGLCPSDTSLGTTLRTDGKLTGIGEDRSCSLASCPGLDKPERHVQAGLVRRAVGCRVSVIAMDHFSGVQNTGQDFASFNGFDVNDPRRAASLWSWETDDFGDGGRASGGPGDAAVFRHGANPSPALTRRWASSSPLSEHRFACGKPRSETTRNPLEWEDPIAVDWKVTQGTGAWAQGGLHCLEEYGDEGYVFSVPVSSFTNERLRQLLNDTAGAGLGSGDVWLNYNAIKKADDWVINQRPRDLDVGGKSVECQGPQGANVVLQASGSDPDGDGLTFFWTGPFGQATGPAIQTILPLGAHPVRLVADDGFSGAARSDVVVTVVDTRAPVIASLAARPSVLWPPFLQMVPVRLTIAASDVCDPTVVCRIVSVDSNEPAGVIRPDWVITGPTTVELRAERASVTRDRVYSITVQCTDDSGNTAVKVVKVPVLKIVGRI